MHCFGGTRLNVVMACSIAIPSYDIFCLYSYTDMSNNVVERR